LVALASFMRLSLRKAAHAAMSSAEWQKIRVAPVVQARDAFALHPDFCGAGSRKLAACT
jgi:hypothetical protein